MKLELEFSLPLHIVCHHHILLAPTDKLLQAIAVELLILRVQEELDLRNHVLAIPEMFPVQCALHAKEEEKVISCEVR